MADWTNELRARLAPFDLPPSYELRVVEESRATWMRGCPSCTALACLLRMPAVRPWTRFPTRNYERRAGSDFGRAGRSPRDPW